MLALVIAALVAFCGHPGRRQSAERHAAPSPSTHGRAPTWAFQYVHFVTRSDGWAMADNDRSGFADLFTSHDGGRRWHDVTPPVVVASDNAWLYDSSHNLDMEKTPGGPIEEAATVQALTPFVLNSRDAWLPVARCVRAQRPVFRALRVHDFRRRPDMGAARAVSLGRVGGHFFPKPLYRFHRDGRCCGRR